MSRTSAREEQAPDYLRQPFRRGDITLIESQCEHCGATIISSVPDIIDKEWQHRRECKRTKAARA